MFSYEICEILFVAIILNVAIFFNQMQPYTLFVS